MSMSFNENLPPESFDLAIKSKVNYISIFFFTSSHEITISTTFVSENISSRKSKFSATNV